MTSALPLLPTGGPALVLLVGPAGSGKSTWAAARYRPTQIVSSDGLRAAITDNESDQRATSDAVALLHALAAARLAHGRLTVIDATNTARSSRSPLLAIATAAEAPAYAVVFTTPVTVCLARNARRSADRQPGCAWARRVPAATVVAQHAATAAALPVLAGEGFTGVHVLDPAAPHPAVRAVEAAPYAS
jgi:predicted kinase